MTWSSDLIQAALIAALIELMLHWTPWRLFLQQDLPRPVAYMLGVLGLIGPLTWLFRENPQAQQALWVVTISGGLAVLFGYGVDRLGIELARRKEAEEREAALIEQIKNLRSVEHPDGQAER